MTKFHLLMSTACVALGAITLAHADDAATTASQQPAQQQQQPAQPSGSKTRVDVSASYIPVATSAAGYSQGGSAAVNVRTPLAGDTTDLTINAHGGYAALEGLGGVSMGFEPNRESGKGGMIGSVGGDCGLVTCTAGAWLGARIATGDHTSVDIQGRVPVIGTFYVNRETGDTSSTLAAARVGFNKQFEGLGRISAFFQADLTDNLFMQNATSGGQKGVGGVFEAGFEADAPITSHLALTAAVDAQDQVFKCVNASGQAANKNDVGVLGSAGIKYAF